MDKTKARFLQARSDLVLNDNAVFWAQLAMSLKPEVTEQVPTWATDGVHIFMNPHYTEDYIVPKYGHDGIIGLTVHEVQHNVAEHGLREIAAGMTNHEVANIAADYTVDYIGLKAGFKIPDPLVDPRYENKPFEWIYSQLMKEKKEQQNKSKQKKKGGQGEGGGKPNDGKGEPRPGEFIRPKDPAVAQLLAQEWKGRILQAAAAAKAAGCLPFGIEQIIDAIKNPKLPWKQILRKLFQACGKNDYSNRLPNKRFVPMGLYMPSLISEQMGPVVIHNDASGSRDYAEARQECLAECVSLVEECQPEITYITSFDTKVYPLGEFLPGEEIAVKSFKGGGGTDFTDCFNWVERQAIQPSCMIIITDGYGSLDSKISVEYPVIWAMTTDVKMKFGEHVRL